jgi:hypothetical protein
MTHVKAVETLAETAGGAAPVVPDYAGAATPRAADRERAAARRRMWAMSVVCAVLLAASIGLNAGVTTLKWSFHKQPVPLRQAITSIPAQLGPWVQQNVDEPLAAEIEQTLRTRDYIQRVYVDTRKADPEVLLRWQTAQVKTPELREELLRSVASRDPLAVVRIHIAYYTGGVDTVPHIPERCMLAGGFDPVGRTQAELDLGDRQLRCSFVQFQERAGHAAPLTFNVAYLFQVNGDYEHDAVTGVRKRLQDLSERYAYFAKIELMTQSPQGSAEQARASMGDFLRYALPEIERVLPDWQAFVGAQRSD